MAREAGGPPRSGTPEPEIAVAREIAATAAHDLNNPLTWVFSGISFALDALEKGDLAQARADLLQARDGAERVHAVVRGMEGFAASGDRAHLRVPRPGFLPPPEPVVASPPAPLRRVLVVDDEPTLVELVEQALAATYTVVSCASPRAALARIEAGDRFDALLCDVTMPELDGLALYAEILRVAPDLAARTVLMTGGAGSARRQAQLAAHPGRMLTKPFGMRALREVLREVAAVTSPA